jgi:hypothetical protein
LTGVNLDLSQIASKPLGIVETGFQAGAGNGWSVTNVGDVDGRGYDDFVIGAPAVTRSGTNVTLGNSTSPPGVVYLIFGSAQVTGSTVTTIDWATLAANGRIGDLSMLGNSTQTNPATGNQGLAYAGVRIFSQNSAAKFGTSVSALGDINGSGLNSFMIGAPNANDTQGGNAGTGRAYIIYGGSALRTVTSIDVDNQLSYPTNVVTLVSNRPLSRLGAAGAGVGDVLTDGFNDIAVAAPNATIAGNANAGAVYLISGTALRNPGFAAVFNVDLTGQTGVPNFVPGVQFTGTSPGDLAGFSLAGANIDGATTSVNQSISDLLIGAPQTGTNNGIAYLIYGGINLANQAVVDPSQNNILSIKLNRIGDSSVTASKDVAGVTVDGAANGDQLGYSIANAGVYSNTSYNDVLIGAPTANSGTGAAYLVFGSPVASRPLGDIPLNAIPSTSVVATLRGASQGDLVGYSVAGVGKINNDNLTEIAVGAPGFNGGYGAVYLIPGSSAVATSSSIYPLANVTGPALNGNQITVASGSTGSVLPAFLGASVAGRFTAPGQSNTTDGDLIGDLIVGAPGFSLTSLGSNPPSTSRNAAGAAFALEGVFLQLGVAGTGNNSASIVTAIGVNSQNSPFTIDASKNQVLIYVFDTTGFNASTDIDPTTTVVNGVAFPTATLAAGNGFAIITISPTSALGLVNGGATITITGKTKAAAGSLTYTGSAAATVINAGGGGGGSGFASGRVQAGAQLATSFPPPNGERLTPTLSQLRGPIGYRQLPKGIALQQFQPSQAYVERTLHGVTGKAKNSTPVNQNALIVKFGHFRHGFGYLVPKSPIASQYADHGVGTRTLGYRVFTRDPAAPGVSYKKHHAPRKRS